MRTHFKTSLMLAAVLAVAGCATSRSTRTTNRVRPSNGYVFFHKPANTRLVYRGDPALFSVDGQPDCYYSRGRFYRRDGDGSWVTAGRLKDGKWKKAKSLPPGLAKKLR